MEKTFSKLKKITGLNWSSYSHSYGHSSPGEDSSNDEECKSHSLRLTGEEKAIFGCYPISGVFEIAVCKYCNQQFKTSAFAEHIRLRHENGKGAEKKDEDKKLVISQSKNRGRHKKAPKESKKISATKELGAPKLILSINEKLVLRECPVGVNNLTQSSPSSSSTPSTPPVSTPTLTPATTPNVTPTGTPVGTPSITPNSTPVKSYSDLKHSENKVKSKQKVKKASGKSSVKNGKSLPAVEPSSKIKEKSKKRGSKKNSVKETKDSTSTKVESCDKPKSNKGTSLQDYPKLSLPVSIKNPDLLKQMQKNRDAEKNEGKVEKEVQKQSSVKGQKDEATTNSPQIQEVIRATLKQSPSHAPTLIIDRQLLQQTQLQSQPQVRVHRNSLNQLGAQPKQLLQQEALKALHRQQMLKLQSSQSQQVQPAQQTGQKRQSGVNTPVQIRNKQFVFIKEHGQKQQNQILKPVVVQGASRFLVVNNSNMNNSDSKRQVRNVIMSKTKENGSSKSLFTTRSSVQPSSSSSPSDSQENIVQWWQPGFKRCGGLMVSKISIPYKKIKMSQNELPQRPPRAHFYLRVNQKEDPKAETEKAANHLPHKEGRTPKLHFVKFNNNRRLRKNDIPNKIKLF